MGGFGPLNLGVLQTPALPLGYVALLLYCKGWDFPLQAQRSVWLPKTVVSHLLLRFQFTRPFLTEFGNLWCHHRLTIRLLGIMLKIIAVVVFCAIKPGIRLHFGNDGPVPDMSFADFFNHLLGDHFLRFIMVKDGRPVLSSCIIPLPI